MNLYKLSILPTFENDLNLIVDYISIQLKSPNSALKLVDEVYSAIYDRLHYPLSFQPFLSQKKRKNPYYVIRVRNYSIFYVVIDSTMEVRRIIYSKRNIDQLI